MPGRLVPALELPALELPALVDGVTDPGDSGVDPALPGEG
jgi:hypothetical protein